MFSVNELIEQIDQDSDIENPLETIEEGEDISNENEEETTENTNNESTASKVEKPKRKRSAIPKLDAERLNGPRGLPCMEKMFSKLKFKGKGYEKQDLDTVMTTLQYWSHRLFPKYTFDDTIAQLERLGTKKPVMTLRKKIVNNLLEDETISDQVDADDEEQIPINEFDLLLEQEPLPTTLVTPQPAVTAEVVELTKEQEEMIARNRLLAAERRRAKLEAIKQRQDAENMSQDSQMSEVIGLTEEQKQIIEKNRLLALERRKKTINKSNIFSNTNELSLSSKSDTLEIVENTQFEENESNSEGLQLPEESIITINTESEVYEENTEELQLSSSSQTLRVEELDSELESCRANLSQQSNFESQVVSQTLPESLKSVELDMEVDLSEEINLDSN